MGDKITFEEKMRMLGRPYKRSSAYKVYGDTPQESQERSVFWETSVRYFEKYEHVKFQSDKQQKKVIGADNIETLEEMLKYWESKGYEKEGEIYSDKTECLKLFYWQRIKKK